MHRHLYTLFILASIRVVYAQGFEYDPYKEFCLRSGHQTAVLDDKLYVDGGRIILQNRKPRNFTNTKLLYHDLSRADNPYTNISDADAPPLFWDTPKGSDVPSVSGGILWPDVANKRLFLYGGEYPENEAPDDFTLWSYDTFYKNWSTVVNTGRPEGVHRLSYGAGTTAEHLGIAYYLGGYRGRMNDNTWSGEKQISSHFLTYNMVGNFWTNQTGTVDGMGRAEGVMTFIPAGDKGLLVYFGGVVSSDGTEASAKESPMDEIQIYDVGNERWYSQKATGNVPGSRRRFCAGAGTAPDSSSYNIYLYGGRGFGNNTDGYDDVYVLSLPSFRWFQLWPDGVKSGERPHYDLSCNVVNESIMIVMGGIFPTDPEAKICDAPSDAGGHFLHLGKTGHATKDYWGPYEPDRKGYTVPPDIYESIGGGPEGGAKVLKPEGGFQAYDLSILFERKAVITPRKANRTFERPSDNKQQSKGSSVVKIAAPVAAAVAVIAALVAAFCLRRRRKIEGVEPKPEEGRSVTAVEEHPPTYSEYSGILTTGENTLIGVYPQQAHASGAPTLPSPVWSHTSYSQTPTSPGFPDAYYRSNVGSADEISRSPETMPQNLIPAELPDSTVELPDSSIDATPQMFQKGGSLWDSPSNRP